ncbi:hypothetical protein J7E49_20105 [Variovorax paradoxus]|nr:hypothetical protein [Variovorax paradoxus]
MSHDALSANLIQMWLTQFDRGELGNEEVEGCQVIGTANSGGLVRASCRTQRMPAFWRAHEGFQVDEGQR